MPIFDTISKQANDQKVKLHTKRSLTWFQKKVDELGEVQSEHVLNDKIRTVSQLPSQRSAVLGHFWMYAYDPKLKDKLPYYDVFPLSVVVRMFGDGMHVLNLHYLPITLRRQLFIRLLDTKNKKEIDNKTRLLITYDLLKSASRYKAFRPCFKKHLYKKIKSKFVRVPATEWELALFVPPPAFVGATPTEVWKDSRYLIGE